MWHTGMHHAERQESRLRERERDCRCILQPNDCGRNEAAPVVQCNPRAWFMQHDWKTAFIQNNPRIWFMQSSAHRHIQVRESPDDDDDDDDVAVMKGRSREQREGRGAVHPLQNWKSPICSPKRGPAAFARVRTAKDRNNPSCVSSLLFFTGIHADMFVTPCPVMLMCTFSPTPSGRRTDACMAVSAAELQHR